MTAFTASAVDLADALANVLPHTDGAASALPVLASVSVEVDAAGLVTFAATDRYTLALAEVASAADSDVVPGTLLIHRRDVADVVKLAKAAKLGEVAFVVEGGNLTVTAPGAALTRLLIEGDFPKYRSLLPEGEPVAVDTIGLGAAHVAKFAKVQRGGRTIVNATLTCTFRSPTKPVDVRVHGLDDFRALVMPVRLQK